MPQSNATRSLHVVLVLKTTRGGAWVVPQVRALIARGHRVSALLPHVAGPLPDQLRAVGASVLRARSDFGFRSPLRSVRGIRAVRRQLTELAPDVVFYHLYASALVARLAAWQLPAKRVHMVAGPLYLDSLLIRTAERLLCRLDDVLIAGSDHTAGRYRELGHPADRLRSIPYGVDVTAFQPATPEAREQARAQHGVPPDAFVAVMVAYVYGPKGLVHRGQGIKGHDLLLEAWQRVRAEVPESRLFLIGGGFDPTGEEHRRALSSQYDLEGLAVTWCDTVADVREMYALADVSVSPSRSENHGAALEAGACGIPSIVSTAGGLPETVTPRSGWTVPVGAADALATALLEAEGEHRAGRLQLRGREARSHVERHFSSLATADRVACEIEAPVGRRPRAGRAPTVISETRIGITPEGNRVSLDGANGDEQWNRYRSFLPGIRLAARSERVSDGVDGTPLQVTPLVPLPEYRGVLGLVRTLPALVWRVSKAVQVAEPLILRAPGPMSLLAGAVAVCRRRPYAVEMVGDPHELLAAGSVRFLGRGAAALSGMTTRWLVRHAAAARYVTTRTLQERYPAAPGIPTAGISNVRLDTGAFAPEPRDGALRNHEPLLLAVGTQANTYKGHDLALRAVARLAARDVDVRLRLVGHGPENANLRRLAIELGIGDRIEFLDRWLNSIDVRGQFDEADVLLHPSRSEGLPRVVIEAMARGLPVVATDVGGTAELLDPPCLVPSEDLDRLVDALQLLCTDQSGRAVQSARNLAVARAYDGAQLDLRFRAWTETLADLR